MQIDNSSRYIASETKRIQRVMYIADKFNGIDLSDIEQIYCYGDLPHVFIDMALKKDKRDSKLAHKLARHFMTEFKKHKRYTSDSLVYVATVDFVNGDCSGTDKITIEISGAVPATCKLVEREVTMTDEEYQQAVASIKRVKVVKEISCEGVNDNV